MLISSPRNLRKVNLLLQAFEESAKDIEYFALDLDRRELERTLGQLPPYKHVRSHGLWGTYDDGRDWLKQPFNVDRQKCVLSLGSSIGEFAPLAHGFFFFFAVACSQLSQGISTATRPRTF